MKEYSIEKFPKNKKEDSNLLSREQKLIRLKSTKKVYTYGGTLQCKRCTTVLPITEFYVANKETGRRHTTCRDCKLKAAGVLEVGKLRFAKKILTKGFRRCSICKNIQPIINFCNSKYGSYGKSNTCRACSYTMSREFIIKHKSNLKPEPKYFFNDLKFFTKESFANYIAAEYNLKPDTVLKRIKAGYSNDKLVLTTGSARSMAYTQGKIKVTDTITGQTLVFTNTSDKGLTSMFSGSAVLKGIRTGTPTKVTSLSKYKNPCIIERIKE